MFDRQPQLVTVTAQIEVAVAPGVEFRGTTQGLACTSMAAFASVVHEQHCGVELALECSQEGEQWGDVGCCIFVDAVETHEGVEHEQAWAQGGDGVAETTAIVFEVDTQSRCGDDMDIERIERDVCGAGDAFEALSYGVQCILGGEEHDGTGVCDGETAQAGRA